jgi:hypothetical protein
MSDNILQLDPLKERREQLRAWLERCKTNILHFKENHADMRSRERLNFIRSQYQLLYILTRVLNNKTRVEGVDIRKFESLIQEENN